MKRSTIGLLKDAALEKALLMLLKPKLEPYGEIRKLELNTSAKIVRGEIQLRGEPTTLIIHEAHYRVERQGEEAFVIVHGVKASKEWVERLLADYAPEIRLRIPAMARHFLD